MKIIRTICIGALALLAGSALAQTATVSIRWALVPLDAPSTAVSTHQTQAQCDAAARALNRTRVYRCDRQLDAVSTVVVPPTCTTPRPATSQVLQCPIGQTGSWTQTRTVTAATYPTCWEVGTWTPAGAPAGACTPIVTPPPPPPPVTGLPTVNMASIPAAGSMSNVYSTRRIATTGEQPRPDAGGIGAARAICGASHFNFDDPLLYPNQKDASHLHIYFGNTGADAFSTSASLLSTGNGTCRGGIINRSAYWAPAIIDTRTGNVVRPEQGNDAHFIYYKTGYFGVRDADVKPIPAGFKMITGDSKSRVAQPRVAHFDCLGVSGANGPTIPACAAGNTLRMSVEFPQCWDGVNVSSPMHKSHVAFPTEGRGCIDPRYPVALPEISMQINYPVPAGGTTGWRLSSDQNGTPAGSSSHGDFMMGWEQDIMQTFVTRVINPGFSASGGIGDGRALY